MGHVTAIRLQRCGTSLTSCLRNTLRMGLTAIAGGIRYFDQDGRVIRVDKKYQSQFNSVLRQVFKDYASRFSFDENGILQYEGSTKGMTQDQTELAKGIKKVMEQNEVTNLFMNLLMTYLLKVERQHLLAHPPELVQFIYLPIKMKIWKKITSSLIRIFQVRYQ